MLLGFGLGLLSAARLVGWCLHGRPQRASVVVLLPAPALVLWQLTLRLRKAAEAFPFFQDWCVEPWQQHRGAASSNDSGHAAGGRLLLAA